MDDTKRHDDLQETAKAQAAFIQYQAMGSERSLAKLCEMLGKPPGYIRALERWSSQYGWQERVKAHDAAILQEQAAELERKRREEIENMHRRHALIGTTFQAKAVEALNRMAGAEEINASVAVNLLKTAIEIERNARGENQQRLEVSGPGGGVIHIETSWGTFKPVEEKKSEQ